MSWEYEVTELSEGFAATVYDDNGRMVADHLSEEHARLIAAAPELLALLVEIDKRVIFDPASGFDRGFNERIEAVLAKAGGRA
jgi:hypothetical protein